MSWQLRRATSDDLDAIMAIETTTFENDAWSRDAMRGELLNPLCLYFVLTREGEPALIDAYAGLNAPPGSPQADIQTIAVAAHARRHGLGRRLMTTMIAEARSRGASELFLEVRADNPVAQELYASLRFEEIAVRPRYYQPDDVDALVMRRALEGTGDEDAAEAVETVEADADPQRTEQAAGAAS